MPQTVDNDALLDAAAVRDNIPSLGPAVDIELAILLLEEASDEINESQRARILETLSVAEPPAAQHEIDRCWEKLAAVSNERNRLDKLRADISHAIGVERKPADTVAVIDLMVKQPQG